MKFEFIPVEEFYFAITLSLRVLDDIASAPLMHQVRDRLQAQYGDPSTVAAASQNSFNYVFRVPDYDNAPSPHLIVSVADWHEDLRISSDYGWTLDEHRKPVRTDKFAHRDDFKQEVRQALSHLLDLPELAP